MINVTMNKQIMLNPDDLMHEFECLAPGNKVIFLRKLIDYICENTEIIAKICHSDWCGSTKDDWFDSKEKILSILNSTKYSQMGDLGLCVPVFDIEGIEK